MVTFFLGCSLSKVICNNTCGHCFYSPVISKFMSYLMTRKYGVYIEMYWEKNGVKSSIYWTNYLSPPPFFFVILVICAVDSMTGIYNKQQQRLSRKGKASPTTSPSKIPLFTQSNLICTSCLYIL